MPSKSEKFEDHIDRLTAIVEKLEQGEIGLQDSINLFEEGLDLVKKCHKTLDDTEGRLRKLVKTDDGFQLSFLDPEAM